MHGDKGALDGVTVASRMEYLLFSISRLTAVSHTACFELSMRSFWASCSHKQFSFRVSRLARFMVEGPQLHHLISNVTPPEKPWLSIHYYCLPSQLETNSSSELAMPGGFGRRSCT